MSQASTDAHLSAAEVFYLLNPLSGDPGVTSVLIFCDGSGQLGCCYPHYVMEGEDKQSIVKANRDRLVEEWTEDGDYFVRTGGDREN